MLKIMINAAALNLKNFLLKNKGVFTITEEKVNGWLEENDHPFRIHYSAEKKEFIIKLIKE